MAISDYTAYLGQQVSILVPFRAMGEQWENMGVLMLVHGVVDCVCLNQDLTLSEFFVDNESYRFSEVTFIQRLANPCNEV